MKRVKFYSKLDLSSGYNLKNAEKVLIAFNKDNCFDINDILEMHNIILYMESGLKLKYWTQEQIDSYASKCKYMKSIIGVYFGNLTDKTIIEAYLQLDRIYRNDFWLLFEKYKLFNKISPDAFTQMLDSNEVQIQNVLECENTVKTYSKELYNSLLLNSHAATILINYFEIKPLNKKLYFPNELTNEDKEKIIYNYIDSKNANINYLTTIKNMKNSDQLIISDKTRLKAKERCEKYIEKIFNENNGTKVEIKVRFTENQSDASEEKLENGLYTLSYSSNWIRENLDFPTIMNNFIYLFNFVDCQMRVLSVSKECDLGTLEKHISVNSKYDYQTGFIFNAKQQKIQLQTVAYYQTLLQNNIRLEKVIEWFFNSYLPSEFQIDGFKIQMPSKESTFLEKCRTIFPEIESILKQYKIFVKEKNVDLDLLQISSGGFKYDDIPSIIQNKYVYGNGEEFNNIKFLLSSDQCLLPYIDRIGGKYDTFYNLISNENVNINEYYDDCKKSILWLQDKNIVHITTNGLIEWASKNKALILYDLCRNDVISFWHYPKNYRNIFSELCNQHIIKFDNTLLSRPEANYISFLLDKSKYVNGYDIRNRYMHGTQLNEHKNCYFIALIILIICIIKINDDICIWDELKKFEDYDKYKAIKDYYKN